LIAIQAVSKEKAKKFFCKRLKRASNEEKDNFSKKERKKLKEAEQRNVFLLTI
jgi:hypothetical protein